MQHSFQTYVDYLYIGVGGQFGVTPYSELIPRWTIGQLAAELMGEYVTQPKNFQVQWNEDFTHVLGIIQQTLNRYAADLGKWVTMKAPNDPTEDPQAAAWEKWRAGALAQ